MYFVFGREAHFCEFEYFLEKAATIATASGATIAGRRLYAIATIEYSFDLEEVGGMVLQEATTLRTVPAAFEESNVCEWWSSNVWIPIVRFMSRFDQPDLLHIIYKWVD